MMRKLVLIFICINLAWLSYSKEQNLIEGVHCTKNTIRIVLNDELKKQNYVLEDFFVEYNDDEVDCTRLDYSIITMPAVMNLITLIWATGDTYYIDAMDEELYYSLQIVKEVFRHLYPITSWEGELKPHSLVNNTHHFLVPQKSDDYIAVLFSHGLDSVCTSLRHSDKRQLLLTARGHADSPLGNNEVWEYLHNLVTSFAEKFKHTPLFFSSNYHSFLNFKYINSTMSPEISSWRLQAIEGLGWIGLTAPILLSKGYKKLYIASSQCWDDLYLGGANPMIDENIIFAGIHTVHDAFDMSREQKNKYVAQECKNLKIARLSLRVCQMISKNKGRNCNNCEKCFRTIAAFLLLGEDVKKFGFDISNKEAIQRIKNSLPSIKLIDLKSHLWRILQQFGKNNLMILDPLHRSFAEWLIQFDIDKITIFRPNKKIIDWNDYVDLYKKIPEYLLKR